MFKIDITTKKGAKVSSFAWKGGECQIGRSKNNDIVLHGWRVSGVHAILKSNNSGPFIRASVDSRNIFVNKKKHVEFGPISDADLVEIGDYRLRIVPSAGEIGVDECAPPSPSSSAERSKGTISGVGGLFEKSAGDKVVSASVPTANLDADAKLPLLEEVADIVTEGRFTAEQENSVKEWRSKLHSELFYIMDLRRVNINDMADEELRRFTGDTIKEVMASADDIPAFIDQEQLIREVIAEAVGLGPLEVLLDNEDVSEIMVNASDEIFYEESGKLKKSTVTFTDDSSVVGAIERIVAPLGRRIDESSPMVDARLRDGSRVNAVIPPLALKGPCITIRKFMKNRLQAEDLVRFGSVSEDMVRFLETAIVRKRNVVISGGTGSGKTTLLNVLSNFIPDDERIVTVEDAAELKLWQPNLVSLEARPPNQEGKGAVHIRDLVKNCLRMRPDRIVVGECRGGEALDMLQAMNTGHDGSLTTIHSNSPRDCISRLEVLVLMSGMDLPVRAIREQISSAVNIIVQQTRFSCGSRRVTNISEVTGVEGETVQLSEIFRFRQDGYDENGKVHGHFEATGLIPEFYEDLRRRGIEVDLSIFREGREL